MNDYFTPVNGTPNLNHLLGRASIISFDVFDTLLTRKVHHPADVFELIERQENIPGFRLARSVAEEAARTRLLADSGSQEVTLAEIYQQLNLPSRQDGVAIPDHAALLQIELAAERRSLVKSPFISALFNLARATGKPIIAISDMYLPTDFLAEILALNGVPVDRIFVSSAYRHSKHEGRLYQIAADALGVAPGEIVHFGDNFQSDCAAALESGVIGYHLPALRDQLARDGNYNQAGISKLQACSAPAAGAGGNLFASLLLGYLAFFKARQPVASAAGQFAAMYGGPLATSFAIWLRLMMNSHNITHMRLAARDGYIIKTIWDTLGFAESASVLQMSRRLTLVPALVENFESEIGALLTTGTTVTLRRCIERLGLADAEPLITALAAHTAIDKPLDTPAKVNTALAALQVCTRPLKDIARDELAGYQAYLASEAFNPDTDALADCGWALSSQRRLELILGRKVQGYYIGSLAHAHLHERIHSFLFHAGKDRRWAAIAEAAVELLELPFATTEAQIFRFEPTLQGFQPVPAVHAENYEAVRGVFIEEMQAEIITFAEFIAPYAAHVTVEEMREALLCLYESLVWRPTAFEYHQIASLPHDREFGQAQFETIGTFWRASNIADHTIYARTAALPTLRDYIRLGWLTVGQAGLRITLQRVIRVFRRRLRARATGNKPQ